MSILVPFTVNRLVNVAPLPVVGPVIVVLEGMFSDSKEVRVIVFCAVLLFALNTVPSKLIFPVPCLRQPPGHRADYNWCHCHRSVRLLGNLMPHPLASSEFTVTT